MFDLGSADLIRSVFLQFWLQYSVFDLYMVLFFWGFLWISVVRKWVVFFVLFKLSVLLIWLVRVCSILVRNSIFDLYLLLIFLGVPFFILYFVNHWLSKGLVLGFGFWVNWNVKSDSICRCCYVCWNLLVEMVNLIWHGSVGHRFVWLRLGFLMDQLGLHWKSQFCISIDVVL